MLDRLVDLIVQFITLFKFWAVYEPYEAGVLLRLGKFVRVLDPGFHWRFPLGIDQCLVEHTVPTVPSLGDESATTADGKSIGFHAIVTYRVKDIQKALLEVADVHHAILGACAGEIGRTLRESTWEEVMFPSMLEDLTVACRKRARRYGIDIISVQLAGLAQCRSIRLLQK